MTNDENTERAVSPGGAGRGSASPGSKPAESTEDRPMEDNERQRQDRFGAQHSNQATTMETTMSDFTPAELVAIHDGENKSLRRAGLRGAYLRKADLRGANLREADLEESDLRKADLRGANLWGANLRNTTLMGANLQDAYLLDTKLRHVDLVDVDFRRANLRDVDLCGAYLQKLDLRKADLRGANLRKADLREADLRGARLEDAVLDPHMVVPESGVATVWKAAYKKIVKCEVPADAERITPLGSRKCRAEALDVIEVFDSDGTESDTTEVCGRRGPQTIYREGERTHPDSFDDDIRIECSAGLHFFVTKREAADWGGWGLADDGGDSA